MPYTIYSQISLLLNTDNGDIAKISRLLITISTQSALMMTFQNNCTDYRLASY